MTIKSYSRQYPGIARTRHALLSGNPGASVREPQHSDRGRFARIARAASTFGILAILLLALWYG